MTIGWRCATAVGGVLATLAVALPVSAQGKSGQPHGKTPAAPPPTTTTLPSSTPHSSGSATVSEYATPAAPFAWMDDASLMAPGSVWASVSTVTWHGSGATELVFPVFDVSIGIAPRLQLGASLPRASGGLGTSFYTAKIAIGEEHSRAMKVAIGPTLEVLGAASMPYGPAGQSRVQWGVPVSVEIDRGATRMYGSSGYFSPGILYVGAGISRQLTDRIGAFGSFSRAWTRTAVDAPAAGAPRRNDLSGGGSFNVMPDIAVYGSLGRTVGTAAGHGAGTTLGVGVSLTAAPGLFGK
jgi:hypothetical protein